MSDAPEKIRTNAAGNAIVTPHPVWETDVEYIRKDVSDAEKEAAVAAAREDALRDAAAICVAAKDKRNKQRKDYPDESRDVQQRWMAGALQSQYNADDILALIDRTADKKEATT